MTLEPWYIVNVVLFLFGDKNDRKKCFHPISALKASVSLAQRILQELRQLL